MKHLNLFSVLSLGLLLGDFTLGPVWAYEYGWIVGRSGPRAGESRAVASRQSSAVGVWMGIASASGVRTGAGAGPWVNLVVHSEGRAAPVKDGATPRLSAPREASPPGSASGAGAKGAGQSRP